MPEMRRVTVRFGESLWDLIEEESNRDGVSAAHWVRDAALTRALWERNRRGEPDGQNVLAAVRAEHRRDDLALTRAIEHVLAHARPELEAVIEKMPPATADWLREVYGL